MAHTVPRKAEGVIFVFSINLSRWKSGCVKLVSFGLVLGPPIANGLRYVLQHCLRAHMLHFKFPPPPSASLSPHLRRRALSPTIVTPSNGLLHCASPSSGVWAPVVFFFYAVTSLAVWLVPCRMLARPRVLVGGRAVVAVVVGWGKDRCCSITHVFCFSSIAFLHCSFRMLPALLAPSQSCNSSSMQIDLRTF